MTGVVMGFLDKSSGQREESSQKGEKELLQDKKNN